MVSISVLRFAQLPRMSAMRFFITRSRLFSLNTTVTHFESPPNLPGLSAEQIRKIGETDKRLRESHIAIESTLSKEERNIVRRKRMIYRSKQRGWLEADVLMGSWAVDNVPSLSDIELDEYEIILKEETINIYNYVSGKDTLPEHLEKLGVMKKLQVYALSKTVIGPEAYKRVKTNTNLT